MICMCVSLWAWWEVVAVHHRVVAAHHREVVAVHHRVVAAHHRVHDYACCHLQADCLESGISSGPLRATMSMGTFTFTY